MLYPLTDLPLRTTLRGLTKSVFGLELQSDTKAKKLVKYIGAPKYKHVKSPHLHAFQYGLKPERPREQRTFQKDYADTTMSHVVRIKYILDNNYHFGEPLLKEIREIRIKLNSVENYRHIRKAIGLPCNGQRTKTNASTSKRIGISNLRIPYYSRNRTKFLKILSTHQTKEVALFAKKLKIQRQEMEKERIIRELQGMRRYRHRSSQNPLEHYETVYQQLKARGKV